MPAFEKGHAKVGGRKKGQLSKGAEEAREKTKRYAPESIRVLIAIQRSPTALNSDKIAASKEILDRAYGKTTANASADAGVTVNVTIKGDDAKL